MPLNRAHAQKYLQKFDFESLFIEELGWDTVDRVTLPFEVDGEPFEVVAISEKRGFTVFKCITPEIPARPLRVKLDRQLTDYSKSHLLVFGDEGKTQQIWMWVRQEPGKPLAPRFEQYQVGQSAERLLQKLEALAIAFAEEEKLTLVEVAQRVKKAFDVEKVTKKFFTRFEKEHGQFLKFIDGIQSEFDRTWYASLMLNRLMFVYFIQKKNFLDGDINYLRNRLKRCQAEWGTDTFHSFYRQFLLKLFHEGLGKPGRDAELDKLLGKVPYLNGGLFEVHQLEEKYEETIQIPDAAFETVFNFFDEYDWHLDDRPLRNQNEINPDVLGYIFEKYINQKQMGAYYTKEDITEYISKNSIIPFLFDAAEKACKIAFKPDGALWALLRENGDRYIYEAVRQGVDLDLPAEIAAGIEDVSQRGGWNKPATEGFALPTETWREHVARRKRCLDLRQKLAAGEVTQINDLITDNLDIRQFAQDVITSCESSDLLKALYQAIEQVSVLDPTCGSGAFLFAALNILEPLYTACLERMQGFVDEDDLRLSREADAQPRYEKFRSTLAEMAKHPNPRYFVLKSIMLNNLYGVDIMEEATEICKLRLFLKLVAQMEAQPKKANFGLEPLPDIDFNIRAGNTLVGFASLGEVRKAITQDEVKSKKVKGKSVEVEADQIKLDLQDDASRIDEKAELADRAFQRFRQMQTEFGMNAIDFRDAKKELRRRLAELNDELNRYLAREYGVDADKPAVFEKWRESHQPFHWFIEFYSIIDRGGFDVIIGNPPYIENKEVKQYKIKGYSCESAGNLYALVIERCFSLGSQLTYQGYIVPVSSISTDRYKPLQELLLSHESHISSFDDRPSRLFEGLEHIRLTIHIIGKPSKTPRIFSTRYNKWSASERDILFDCLRYAKTEISFLEGTVPKFSSEIEFNISSKLSQKSRLKRFYNKSSPERIFYSRKVGYFLQVLDFEPKVLDGQGNRRPPSEFKELNFPTRPQAEIALCCLNSNLFYWFITVCSDCRHVNKREVDSLPIDLSDLEAEKDGNNLVELAQKLMQDIDDNSEERKMRFKHDTLSIQCIFPAKSKPIIDEIDRVLAQHYGFTAEELDFIINYDIKYRMGRDSGGDD
jgi:type I restriction-modification system DNA methylase subunit